MKQSIRIACTGADSVPLQSIFPFQGDLKSLSPINYEKLKQQILEHGFTSPFHLWHDRDADKTWCLDGHQRLRVLMRLKQDGYLIPDLPVDYIAARSEKEAKQILLAHASQYGNVDSQGLYEFISKADIGIDEMMQSSSFPEIDLDAFKAEFLDDPAAEQGNGDADAVPEIPKNVHNVQRGQIWQLGEHRLMCGDSTSKEDVAKLMDGQKADMVFTDPPYGVSYQSNMRTKTEKFDVLKNDEIFIDGWLPHAGTFSTGWVFIWTTWKVLQKWFDITNDFAPLTNMVVWDKGGGGIGDLEKTFSTDYEIALVFNRGAKITGKRLGSV